MVDSSPIIPFARSRTLTALSASNQIGFAPGWSNRLFSRSEQGPEAYFVRYVEGLRAVETVKSQYLLGEAILVKTTFQNVSSIPIGINKEFWAWPDDCELTFEIEASSGDKLEKLRAMIRRPDLSRNDFKEGGFKFQVQRVNDGAVAHRLPGAWRS